MKLGSIRPRYRCGRARGWIDPWISRRGPFWSISGRGKTPVIPSCRPPVPPSDVIGDLGVWLLRWKGPQPPVPLLIGVPPEPRPTLLLGLPGVPRLADGHGTIGDGQLLESEHPPPTSGTGIFGHGLLAHPWRWLSALGLDVPRRDSSVIEDRERSGNHCSQLTHIRRTRRGFAPNGRPAPEIGGLHQKALWPCG